MSGICTSMRAGSDVPFAYRKGLHRLGKGFQEWEEKRAEAKIAQRIVQIPLMESYDLHTCKHVDELDACGGRRANHCDGFVMLKRHYAETLASFCDILQGADTS
jgi:hypothetical protein